MHYLATIQRTYDSETKLFKTMAEAQQWIDQNNTSSDNSYISTYDSNWNKIDSFMYTEAAK